METRRLVAASSRVNPLHFLALPLTFLDITFSDPASNLACDEALLEMVEQGEHGEILRFWESQKHFVVLGSSNKVRQEVETERCEADGVPILRRHSGGGTVLQGPGCLNFSLVLRIHPAGPTRDITTTTNHVMLRHAEVLSDLLREKVEMRGSSDLTIAGRKCSGNAQRRKLNALLFHGTFLLGFQLDLIERYLKLPPKQPAYRNRRTHLEFVQNVAVSSSLLKEKLRAAWKADDPFGSLPAERIQQLVDDKYSRKEWNFRM